MSYFKRGIFKQAILLFVLIFPAFYLSAQDSNFAFKINGGINFSDVNYGNEFLRDFLPRSDYQFYSAGGDSDRGFNIGLGASFQVSPHLILSTNIDYTKLAYQIDGEVMNLDPEVTRPINPELPIEAVGTIGYYFLDIEAVIEYSFNNNCQKGLFAYSSISNMIHLDSKWKVEVVYEDLSTGSDKDLSKFPEPDYNNLWFIGLGLGYNIPLNNNFTLTPIVDLRLGLNSFVADYPSPSVAHIGLEVKRWF